MSYEECFADDESDISESSLSRDDIHNGQINQDIVESTADNECVFDTEWALKRRYSLSSLLYSRLLLRLKDKMKMLFRHDHIGLMTARKLGHEKHYTHGIYRILE